MRNETSTADPGLWQTNRTLLGISVSLICPLHPNSIRYVVIYPSTWQCRKGIRTHDTLCTFMSTPGGNADLFVLLCGKIAVELSIAPSSLGIFVAELEKWCGVPVHQLPPSDSHAPPVPISGTTPTNLSTATQRRRNASFELDSNLIPTLAVLAGGICCLPTHGRTGTTPATSALCRYRRRTSIRT